MLLESRSPKIEHQLLSATIVVKILYMSAKPESLTMKSKDKTDLTKFELGLADESGVVEVKPLGRDGELANKIFKDCSVEGVYRVGPASWSETREAQRTPRSLPFHNDKKDVARKHPILVQKKQEPNMAKSQDRNLWQRMSYQTRRTETRTAFAL